MKRLMIAVALLAAFLFMAGFAYEQESTENFSINELYDYQKEYKTSEMNVCSISSTKTYMDYRATTARDSVQYWFIREQLTVDETTGFLYDEDGFIGAALGSYFGEIGDRFYFTLDSGIVLPIVKCEEKADRDTDSTGCYHTIDGSVIEFVIDRHIANDYFGAYGNGLVLQGNYNNYRLFRGNIVRVERVLDEKNDHYVTYSFHETPNENAEDIFFYASGY